MSDSPSKSKIIALVCAVLLFVSLLFTARYVTLNGESVSMLNTEKLKTESLLSEKLQLEKEIIGFKADLKSLTGKNTELDKLLAESQKSLAEKEAQLRQINSSRNLNKQIADLKSIRTSLESQIASLNHELTRLRDENGALRQQNENATAMIAHLEKENKDLSENLGLLSAMTEDNLVLVTNKNEKLTVNSKKARKIDFIFDVPQSSLGGLEFKVVSPNSKVYSKSDGSITYHILPGEGTQVASLGVSGNFELVQKVEMQFRPKEMLSKGIYKIEVYNTGTRIGSMQVKLR